jgi:hypothetical protein
MEITGTMTMAAMPPPEIDDVAELEGELGLTVLPTPGGGAPPGGGGAPPGGGGGGGGAADVHGGLQSAYVPKALAAVFLSTLF